MIKAKQHEWFDDDGKIVSVSVERAADQLGVSERRVRQMLDAGTLTGEKSGRAWRVKYPFSVKLGTRGPASAAFKQRSHTPKKRWKSSSKPSTNLKKGT